MEDLNQKKIKLPYEYFEKIKDCCNTFSSVNIFHFLYMYDTTLLSTSPPQHIFVLLKI